MQQQAIYHVMESTGEPLLDLLAAVWRRAIFDATNPYARTHERMHAVQFLDETLPEWRQEGRILYGFYGKGHV